MAKNSGNLYCALPDTDDNILPVRSADDPPPYSEVDPTVAIVPAPVIIPSAPLPTSSSGTSGALEYVAEKRRRFMRATKGRRRKARSNPLPTSPGSPDSAPTVLTRGVALASKSIDVVCPHCKADIRTSIEKRPGLLAYLSGAVMACLCCFCGCCLIPCCIEECMEVKHTCPNCDGLIGKYRL